MPPARTIPPRRRIASALVAGLVACAQEPHTDAVEAPEVDAPVLVHAAPLGSFVEGGTVALTVEATDPDGVREVSLYHRVEGAGEDQRLPLESADGLAWTGEVELRAPGLSYTFRAFDDSPFLVSADLPADGERFTLPVDVVARPAPFSESFDAATSTLDLYVLGWDEASLGPTGNAWELSELRSTSAPWSVRHRAGVGGPWDDWLASPTLDLSSLPTAQVTWQEHGLSSDEAAHSLWVSTGSPEPADGDFVLAAELAAPPEDAWARSQLVDLSAWAGEPRVTLAWRYEGTDADDWTIDDVAVAELGPDLVLVSLTQTPLAPGEAGELSLVLENRGAPASSIALQASAGSVFFDSPVAPGLVVVPLTVDPAVPDDSLLPATFTATADGATFSWERDLIVGDPAVATVGFELDGTGFVEVVVGGPEGEVTAWAGILGPQAHTVQVDLAGFGALPPAPDQRWYVRFDSAVSGSLTDFAIAHDGALSVADDLGDFDALGTFWLPSRPDPAVSWSAVDPVLAPDGEARWELTLDNLGGATVGPTTLTITSPDGRASFEPADWDLGADWSGAAAVEPTVAVGDVRDSRPVPVTLTVTDAVESYVVATELPVPWPVLYATAVLVDGDGVPDPGEAVQIGVTVANAGDLGTGLVDCALSGLEVTSGAVALDLAPGARATPLFDVVVPEGVAGDVVDLALTCGAHAAEVDLVLGEPQWTWLTDLPDDWRDAVGAYAFDVHHARWRVLDGDLQLEVVADAPFDPGAVLIEAWASSPYAYWELYQLTAVNGVGTLRGYYLAAWWVLDPPVVSSPDPETLRVVVDLDDLALAESSLSFGLGAGFCGAASYFCDNYPDGWGDPYQAGLVTDAWVTIGW